MPLFSVPCLRSRRHAGLAQKTRLRSAAMAPGQDLPVITTLSFPRKRESTAPRRSWTPAFAGVTQSVGCASHTNLRRGREAMVCGAHPITATTLRRCAAWRGMAGSEFRVHAGPTVRPALGFARDGKGAGYAGGLSDPPEGGTPNRRLPAVLLWSPYHHGWGASAPRRLRASRLLPERVLTPGGTRVYGR
jgi:hypothetical protein